MRLANGADQDQTVHRDRRYLLLKLEKNMHKWFYSYTIGPDGQYIYEYTFMNIFSHRIVNKCVSRSEEDKAAI